MRAVGATLGESKEGKARRVRKVRGEAQCARRKREREMRLREKAQITDRTSVGVCIL